MEESDWANGEKIFCLKAGLTKCQIIVKFRRDFYINFLKFRSGMKIKKLSRYTDASVGHRDVQEIIIDFGPYCDLAFVREFDRIGYRNSEHAIIINIDIIPKSFNKNVEKHQIKDYSDRKSHQNMSKIC